MKIVIVGGVAGGASTAARLRRLNEDAEIIILERSGYISYANCGLPYYIGGVIEDEEDLTLQTPQSFYNRFRIDARVHHEAVKINREQKTVAIHDLANDCYYEESYDKLVLAPGATAIKPPLPGIDHEKIVTLRTVEDTLKIRKMVVSNVKSAIVVGGGFIGVEAAENLKEMGIDVTLIDQAPQVLSQLDEDMISFVHAHMKTKGIRFMLGTGVTGFEETDEGIKVLLNNQMCAEADLVLLAIGVVPDSHLAKEAGLALDVRNSIKVNEHMQTSDPDIYAVGDAVAINHLITGQKATISLAGPANKQGRIAADHMSGIDSCYHGSAASSILKVFDLAVASTGINERVAKMQKIAYDKVIVTAASHASYYPGGTMMTIKLLFRPDDYAILGAQIVGFDGVDKRIDVIATAMQAKMNVIELKNLDLAYAPPFASAKDPINMVGFVAENVITGKIKQAFYEDLPALRKDDTFILMDTRTPTEYAKGHAEGFETHIPVDELRDRISELDPSKKVVVMCHSGLRSYIACRILKQHGFDVYNFAGGYRFYKSVTDNVFDETIRTNCGIK